MKKYKITGMSCAACSARVERAVGALGGVNSCAVNLLTNSMTVEGSVKEEVVIDAVTKAGYGASLDGAAQGSSRRDEKGVDGEDTSRKEIRALLTRLISSAFFLAILMYISMGYVMWGAPLPDFLSDNPVAVALLELLLSAIVLVINQRFFINGARGVIHLAPNMDTLVSLGSGASFIYSSCVVFLMTAAQANGDGAAAAHYLHELYFEAAAMILTLITVGKLLETVSKGRTTRSLRALIDLSPKSANLLVGDEEKLIDAAMLKKGDIFIVRPGESIPADGVVIKGESSVNESALTGESVPADKTVGSTVFAGTINTSGFITCEAVHTGEDSSLAEIIRIVSDATASKAPIARIADRVSGVFVPIVMGIAALTFAVWLIAGETVPFALARGISVLVISCPCALGLATPVAIMVGSGVGAKKGILFKSATALEECGKATVVVLDKTGTVTKGEMAVTDTYEAEGTDKKTLLSLACSLEKMSEHPLGEAIVGYCKENHAEMVEISSFAAISGRGVEGEYNGEVVRGGKLEFIREHCDITSKGKQLAETLANQGKTPMFFSYGNRFIGIIAVADTVKEDSAEAISELKSMGVRTIMLTGDNLRTATAIAEIAGVDEIIADVLPDGKAAEISRLKAEGNRVIMVGDGINDAPALAIADTGIAIGAGTDVAIEAADVVLVGSKLTDLVHAIKLSRKTLKNIRENLFWAFCYNVTGIPLAAGVFIPLLGWEMNPMFGAAAMSLSSFCVVMNALRLNLVDLKKPYGTKRSKNKKSNKAEKRAQKMKKTIKIEGMMCPHCSGRVKNTLAALDGVAEVEVSHVTGLAIVTLAAPVTDEVLTAAIEAQGYSVLGIE